MAAWSHSAGVDAALLRYGVSKYASVLSPEFWKDVAHSVRTQAFGHPVEALKQIGSGTLFNPENGLYHHGLPRTMGALAGNLAIPLALTALYAKMNPPENRGELIGDMLGRTTGSLLGAPLAGVAGQIGGGVLLSNVGRTVGRQIDSMRAPRAPVDDTQQ